MEYIEPKDILKEDMKHSTSDPDLTSSEFVSISLDTSQNLSSSEEDTFGDFKESNDDDFTFETSFQDSNGNTQFTFQDSTSDNQFTFQDSTSDFPEPNPNATPTPPLPTNGETKEPLFQQSSQSILQTVGSLFPQSFRPPKKGTHNIQLLDEIVKGEQVDGTSNTQCTQCKSINPQCFLLCIVCGKEVKERDRERRIVDTPNALERLNASLSIEQIPDTEDYDIPTNSRYSSRTETPPPSPSRSETPPPLSLRSSTPPPLSLRSSFSSLPRSGSLFNLTLLSSSSASSTPSISRNASSSSLSSLSSTSSRKDPDRIEIRTNKYGFIVDAEEEELRRKFEQIHEQQQHKDRLNKWNKFMETFDPNNFNSKVNPIKQMIRDGVPDVYRTKIWLACSGAGLKWKQNKGYYKSLLTKYAGKTSEATRNIEQDVQRTFTTNLFFRNEDTLNGLRRILTAYSWHNPRIGYCQGTSYICAMLLLIMKEEAAFWMFVTILEDLLPTEYFTETLLASRIDQLVFNELISQKIPQLRKKVESLSSDMNVVTVGWFMSLYVNTLPAETTLRVWDVFLNEGSKILFRVGLALLKMNQQKLMTAKDELTLYNMLKTMQVHNPDTLLQVAFKQIGSFPMSKIEALRTQFKPQALESLREYQKF